jgi:hypothetical protein
MKQDKFLLGILIGIAVLVVAAFALFFIRQPMLQYVDDSTPSGVVQDFVIALHKGDYPRAYGYLASGTNKPTLEEFRSPFLLKQTDISSTELHLGEESVAGNGATVRLDYSQYYGSPYDVNRGYWQADLVLENGQWKIIQMPPPYWFYDWYQPKQK